MWAIRTHPDSDHCCVLSGKCEAVDGWPSGVREIRYRSSADQSDQPALFFSAPKSEEPRPLLIGLHTWGGDYRQTSATFGAPYARWCAKKRWHFIYPNFRGPNRRPEACGSELVIRDVLSAVTHAESKTLVDRQRIYLIGVSGGGHLALLLAGRHPEKWAGVSAWVPILDLARWHAECLRPGAKLSKYARDLENVCGGAPGASPGVDRQYALRSPLTWLARAKNMAVDINAGVRDGHSGSVPIGHSLRAYNQLVPVAQRVSEKDIRTLERVPRVPADLRTDHTDSTYASRRPLLRREWERARVTIFDGGHEIVPEAALNWLSRQRRKP